MASWPTTRCGALAQAEVEPEEVRGGPPWSSAGTGTEWGRAAWSSPSTPWPRARVRVVETALLPPATGAPASALSAPPARSRWRDDTVGPVFAALADGTRRQVVQTLATGQGATATSLAAELPMTRQAVAKHLAALRRAELVRSTRRGRETVYELEPGALTEAASWIAAVGGEWDERLERLGRLVD